MRKELMLIGAVLVCAIAISFGLASYLLNTHLLPAVLLIGLYFLGGMWLPTGAVGTKLHASWLGISIGFFAAVLCFLPVALVLWR